MMMFLLLFFHFALTTPLFIMIQLYSCFLFSIWILHVRHCRYTVRKIDNERLKNKPRVPANKQTIIKTDKLDVRFRTASLCGIWLGNNIWNGKKKRSRLWQNLLKMTLECWVSTKRYEFPQKLLKSTRNYISKDHSNKSHCVVKLLVIRYTKLMWGYGLGEPIIVTSCFVWNVSIKEKEKWNSFRMLCCFRL